MASGIEIPVAWRFAADICICDAIASGRDDHSSRSVFSNGLAAQIRGCLIPVKEPRRNTRINMLGLSFSGVGFMSESKNNDHNAAAGASAQPVDRNPVSAVRLPADLTADIDAWAGVHAINRSEAIRRLIELGLKSSAAVNAMRVARPDAIAVEQLAVSQISRFIDPGTPEQERERRIHRLTEGPPEFVDVRIDLPPKR
jgi:hypothetical protein